MGSSNFQENQGPKRFDCQTERQMRQGFIEVAETVISEEAAYRKDGTTLYAGMELEFPLITKDFSLVPQEIRDEILRCFPGFTSVELGAHQLEVIHKTPVDLRLLGFCSLKEAMRANLKEIQKELQKRNVTAARIGCYPLVELSEVDYTKGDPKYAKYKQSPAWHLAQQRPDAVRILQLAEKIDVSDTYVVALMNAVQITVDADSFENAIDKLNRSLMISPMAIALGANSRYLGGVDTGYADVRLIAWEISHDSRSDEEIANGLQTRVGLPQRYYKDLNDYFNCVLDYPFVMNDPVSLQHPFEVGNGIYWRDARLKFLRDKKTIAVEFRPVPLQPTLHEDIGMMAFYVGRLLWSENQKEPLLPFEFVKENRDNAMKFGLDCGLYSQNDSVVRKIPADIALAREVARAEEGLLSLNISMQEIACFMEPLRNRLLVGGNPAELFHETVKKHEQQMNRRDALISAMGEFNLFKITE